MFNPLTGNVSKILHQCAKLNKHTVTHTHTHTHTHTGKVTETLNELYEYECMFM